MYEHSIPEFSFRKTGVCNVITKKIFAEYVLNSDLRPQMCCWVLPEGRCLFHAFPEVICVDGTPETNNESRPLLTLSVKDSNGRVYCGCLVHCPQLKDLGFSVGCSKKPFLWCFLVHNNYIP
jgi:hypothetical protein